MIRKRASECSGAEILMEATNKSLNYIQNYLEIRKYIISHFDFVLFQGKVQREEKMCLFRNRD